MDQTGQLPPDRQCCDLDFLEISLGRNRKTAIRLAGMFVDAYPRLRQKLEESLAARDSAGFGSVLHDIRGSCTLFSAQDCLAQTIRLQGFLRATPDALTSDADGIDWPGESAILLAALECLHNALCAYLAWLVP